MKAQQDISDQTLVLTVNDRLARFLLEESQSSGVQAAPMIYSFEAWLSGIWDEIALTQALPYVLSEAEALFQWKKILKAEGEVLFQIHETAQKALQAYDWEIAYGLCFEAHTFEVKHYFGWKTQFLRWKKSFPFELCLGAERLRYLLENAEISLCSLLNRYQKISLRGFDFLTPLQETFFDFLNQKGWEIENIPIENQDMGIFKVWMAPSPEDEIKSALEYARLQVEAGSKRIGIVIPHLPDHYLWIKRLAPYYLKGLPYVISAGLPLNQTPWVKKALKIIQSQMAYFPEAPLRVQLDWALKLCDQVNWLGENRLSSVSYQTVQVFYALLEKLSRNSVLMDPMSPSEMLEFLSKSLEVPFQEEDPLGAKIFILGMLEAAPLSFDSLWLCGVSSDQFPVKPEPNPFIPYDLQKEKNLPRSSADREAFLAQKMLFRMAHQNTRFIVSFPQKSDGVLRELSPLIPPMRIQTLPSHPLELMRKFSPKALDSLKPDLETSLSVSPEEIPFLKGGSQILAFQAACPFKAFARFRLGVSVPEVEAPYFSYREKGIFIHEVLYFFWKHIRSQEKLLSLSQEALLEWIDRGISEAFSKASFRFEAHARLEKERIREVVLAWLNFEKTRQGFQIQQLETEIQTLLAGLPLKLRVDRVDQMAENIRVVIDYKTGKLSPKDWDADRLESPQLPIYATLTQVDGLALADLSGRAPSLLGIFQEGLEDPAFEGDRILNFEDKIQRWRGQLHDLASAFMQGKSEVDPTPAACRYCGLEAICRVKEKYTL